ncbi:MAG: CbiX/SirB N-terminal domain-containing protein [Candidatus Velthaea sp.]
METQVVLAGHGSRSAEANASLKTLAASVAKRLGAPVSAAYLEMAEPSIPTTIHGCVLSGARKIVIVPYFLHPGMHVRRDIVEIADAARSAHPQVEITVADFLGSHPGVADVLTEITRGALH